MPYTRWLWPSKAERDLGPCSAFYSWFVSSCWAILYFQHRSAAFSLFLPCSCGTDPSFVAIRLPLGAKTTVTTATPDSYYFTFTTLAWSHSHHSPTWGNPEGLGPWLLRQLAKVSGHSRGNLTTSLHTHRRAVADAASPSRSTGSRNDSIGLRRGKECEIRQIHDNDKQWNNFNKLSL